MRERERERAAHTKLASDTYKQLRWDLLLMRVRVTSKIGEPKWVRQVDLESTRLHKKS